MTIKNNETREVDTREVDTCERIGENDGRFSPLLFLFLLEISRGVCFGGYRCDRKRLQDNTDVIISAVPKSLGSEIPLWHAGLD